MTHSRHPWWSDSNPSGIDTGDNKEAGKPFLDALDKVNEHTKGRPTSEIIAITTHLLYQQVVHLLTMYSSDNERHDKGPWSPETHLNEFGTSVAAIEDEANLLRVNTAKQLELHTDGHSVYGTVEQTSDTVNHIKETLIQLLHLRDLLSSDEETNALTMNKERQPVINGDHDILTLQDKRDSKSGLSNDDMFDVNTGSSRKVNLLDLLERSYHLDHCKSIGDRCGWMQLPCCHVDIKYKTMKKLCCRKDLWNDPKNMSTRYYGICLPQLYDGDPCQSK